MKKTTIKKNSNEHSKKTNRKKNKKPLQLFLIIIFITIVLTLLISEYIRDFFQSNIETNTIKYSQELEQNNDISTKKEDTSNASPEKKDIHKKQTNTKKEDTSDTIEITLYFITIINETQLKAIKYIREIPFTLSVLTTTLKQLLLGPNKNEQSSGAKSFIPNKTVIKKIYIDNNIVFLDLNDEFQFNTFGRLGVLAQLLQIVYTCTEFQNIDAVQILVEGKKLHFLSGDAGLIAVDNPLTRNILLEYAETFSN